MAQARSPWPLWLALAATLGGCASGPEIVREQPPAGTAPSSPAAPTPPTPPASPTPSAPVPAPQPPRPGPSPAPVPVPLPAPVPMPPSPPVPVVDAAEVRALALRLLPRTIADRNGWANDIATSFASLGIPALPHKLCALAAVIEQESTWSADPPVAGLARIAREQLDKKREAYGIPTPVFELALSKTSPTGRTYRQRLDSLRTERELSDLYEDIVREIPFGATFLGGQNPVRTGGSTQVSISWSDQLLKQKAYPWQPHEGARKEVFKRRGGIYFGAAMLLDYPVSYNRMIYRFADYNAGRYSSRNAAVQSLLAQLTGQAIAPDGDLLRYRAGEPLPTRSDPSQAWTALKALQAPLGLSDSQIERDLRLEKRFEFEQSETWRRLMALAAQRGLSPEHARLPDLLLQSPKITRPLTTAWFANRCEARYRSCLARAAADTSPASNAAGAALKLVDDSAP